jgi:hypothetical protein
MFSDQFAYKQSLCVSGALKIFLTTPTIHSCYNQTTSRNSFQIIHSSKFTAAFPQQLLFQNQQFNQTHPKQNSVKSSETQIQRFIWEQSNCIKLIVPLAQNITISQNIDKRPYNMIRLFFNIEHTTSPLFSRTGPIGTNS